MDDGASPLTHRIFKEKTCFIIAHRISSVMEADLILVMDNGRIIERGKHEDLLRKKGYCFATILSVLVIIAQSGPGLYPGHWCLPFYFLL